MGFKYFLFYFAGAIPLIFFPILPDSFQLPKSIGIFFLTTLLYLSNIKSKKIDIKKNPFFLPFILFILWTSFTLKNCVNPYPGILKIFIWIFFFIYFYSLTNSISENSEIIILMRAFVLFSFFVSIYGIFQTFGIDFVNWTFKKSPLSTLGRRNFAAEYLVMIFPYLYTLILISKNKEKFIYIFISIFLFTHLILTFTRASWISFFFSSLFFLFSLKKFKLKLKKLQATFLLFIILISPVFSQVKKFEKGSVKTRLLIWKTTLRISKDHLLTGIGPGNFEIVYPLYASKYKDSILPPDVNIKNVHNDYLEVMVETGIIGLSIFLWFLSVPFFLYKNISEKERILFLGALTSIFAMYINSLFSFPFKRITTLYIFWTSLAIISVLRGNRRCSGKIFPNLTFIIYFLSSLLFLYRAIMSNIYCEKAVASKNNVLREKFVERCVEYCPYSIEFNFWAGNVMFYIIQDFDKALYYYSKTISLSPYYSAAYNNIGIIYHKKGDIKKAEDYYLKAIKFNPNRAESYNNLGSLYLENGKIEKAIDCFKKCISIRKDFYLAYFNLGVAYYTIGKYKLSKNYFEKTLKLKPNFKPALNYLSKLRG